MDFVSIRVITEDVAQLAAFYGEVTGLDPVFHGPDFAEIHAPTCTLAIGSTRTLALFGGEVARPAANHTAILEFRVGDVDGCFGRIADLIGERLVQPPTTMPWGNRSLLFRDPDGNLVNLFAPVTPEAVARLRR